MFGECLNPFKFIKSTRGNTLTPFAYKINIKIENITNKAFKTYFIHLTLNVM